MKSMRKLVSLLTTGFVSMAFTGIALAQSGHFLDRTVACRDVGTQVLCSGKVSGLGGTTFNIEITATGTASVECENHGGNVAPGQDTAVTTTGETGPQPTPRNGNFNFSFTTVAPTVDD